MIAMVVASAIAAVSTPAADSSTKPADQPTRYCREMGNASSRLYSIKVCKTRAQWRRWEACHSSVTRYCTPRKRSLAAASLGRQTAYPLNENSRIVCRLVKQTGTRIVTHELCLPKREWERMWVETSEGLRERQGDHSTLPRSVR